MGWCRGFLRHENDNVIATISIGQNTHQVQSEAQEVQM
jgi:hypothetical protein